MPPVSYSNEPRPAVPTLAGAAEHAVEMSRSRPRRPFRQPAPPLRKE